MPTTNAERGAGSRLRPGSSVLVVLTGESGAGKTTLCVGAAAYAKSRGLSVGGLLSLPHPAGDGNEWRRVTDIGSGGLPPGRLEQIEHAMPDTVQAVIGAKVDRLGEPEKTLLQMCAIIGKEIPMAVRALGLELLGVEGEETAWTIRIRR